LRQAAGIQSLNSKRYVDEFVRAVGGSSLVAYQHTGHLRFRAFGSFVTSPTDNKSAPPNVLAQAVFVCCSRKPMEKPYFQVEQDCEAADEEAA
jgi:hypothetical protein